MTSRGVREVILWLLVAYLLGARWLEQESNTYMTSWYAVQEFNMQERRLEALRDCVFPTFSEEFCQNNVREAWDPKNDWRMNK